VFGRDRLKESESYFFGQLAQKRGQQKNRINYYPFGLQHAGGFNRVTSLKNDYLFNGKERITDLNLNWDDFGARMYDPSLGRFHTIDPLGMIFQSYTPYQYGLNNPIRFEDWEGMGPGDRVKMAKSMVGTPYSMAKGVNTSIEQRTGLTIWGSGARHLDCSEFVYRVLESDGLVDNRGGNTHSLLKEFSKSETWIKSNSPEIGDAFLWRNEKKGTGHTGIVTGIVTDEEGNVTGVEITHAKGTAYGTVTEVQTLDYFTGRSDWQGFFRPVKEFRPDRIERKEGETTEEWIKRAENRLARMNANAEINRKKREKRREERERRRKKKEEEKG